MKTFRKINIRGLFLALISLVSSACSSNADEGLGVEFARELVAFVDKLEVPLSNAALSKQDPEAVEGERQIKLQPDVKLFPQIAAAGNEITASLCGTPKSPKAVIFWIQDEICYYYVPFKGVSEVDRRRRLSKVSDRVYKIESNRSRQGVVVTGKLP